MKRRGAMEKKKEGKKNCGTRQRPRRRTTPPFHFHSSHSLHRFLPRSRVLLRADLPQRAAGRGGGPAAPRGHLFKYLPPLAISSPPRRSWRSGPEGRRPRRPQPPRAGAPGRARSGRGRARGRCCPPPRPAGALATRVPRAGRAAWAALRGALRGGGAGGGGGGRGAVQGGSGGPLGGPAVPAPSPPPRAGASPGVPPAGPAFRRGRH